MYNNSEDLLELEFVIQNALEIDITQPNQLHLNVHRQFY